MDRWATFDCYGTLVDWQAGIGLELGRLFGAERAEDLLTRYQVVEPVVESEPGLHYREVLARTLTLVAQEAGLRIPSGEEDALARSLPSWPVFEDVPDALGEVRERGWRLAVLSNSDRDLIEPSIAAIGIPFDHVVLAGEIGSYKPHPRHWEVFAQEAGARPDRHIHVAQSRFHDVAPAGELGIPCVWINRLGEEAEGGATVELTGLGTLPDVLDELVPR